MFKLLRFNSRYFIFVKNTIQIQSVYAPFVYMKQKDTSLIFCKVSANN